MLALVLLFGLHTSVKQRGGVHGKHTNSSSVPFSLSHERDSIRLHTSHVQLLIIILEGI